MLKKTPLYEVHRSFNAKMTDFSGYEMPIQYQGIKKEHLAVRNNAGLFDVSHMGEILIHGEKAPEVIQELTVNDSSKLKPGKARYTVMCREHGGIVDDLLVYCLSENEYLLVVNASNIDKDFNWILEVNAGRAEVSNISDEIALIALQGPEADRIIDKLTPDNPRDIPLFEFRSMKISDYDNILVSATGYTGEKGYELYCNIRHVNACDLWENIIAAGDEYGIMPCGLGARDTLRLEAGLALYGNDLSEEVTPLEAGLGWLVKWDQGDFIGKQALIEQKENGIRNKLAGMVIKSERSIPRNGQKIMNNHGESIGRVTSGGMSFVLEKGIAMGYIPAELKSPGNSVYINIRDKSVPAETVKMPFYKR